ncbi:MAG: hypothetical protein LIR46_03735 [Bacteroidota bacterium]|nr:hypothetical protein [Bacteroidota bacterium]
MKRVNNLFDSLISDENLLKAIEEVNRTHHWKHGHKPNKTTAWVEMTKEKRVKDLRNIILNGFQQNPPKIVNRYDVSAKKWRTISEPAQWPDQYIHHALVQVLQPVMMRGMDKYCCGSIKGRGTHYAKHAIEVWMKTDAAGTKYCLCMDIRHFYDNLNPVIVMLRLKHLIKDYRILNVAWRVVCRGIKIGAYPSQWFANTTLQPLDVLIRQSGLCNHYVRYMDNITIFGSNIYKLRQLKYKVEHWLNTIYLQVKGDWQIYSTDKRLPNAVGYRYGRDYVLPRKNNLLRLKRALSRYRRRVQNGEQVSLNLALSILSRLGQLKHCNNYSLYKSLFKGERIFRNLKKIANKSRSSIMTWDTYMTSLSTT